MARAIDYQIAGVETDGGKSRHGTANTDRDPPRTRSQNRERIQQLRDLFADAPELGKKALENTLHELKSQASDLLPAVESAGRVGARRGKVSELTITVPLKHQITAEGWYVAYPDLTVAEIKRLQRIGKAVDEFLDKVG